jgi:hypothetical protein
VDVPAEEEGGVGGKGEGGEEGGEVGSEEELCESRLEEVVSGWRKWERRGCTSWVRMVRMKVRRGVISGRTAKEVSPTRPRVTLVTASRLTERWR